MNRTILAAALLTSLVAAGPAMGQPIVARTAQQPGIAPPVDELSARDTQQRLEQLLRGYPPSLRRVLQLDPALLTNEAYLAPYPALALFVAQHPDIVHHASFYLGQPDNENREDSRSRAIRGMVDIVSYATTLFGFIAFFITISWLARLLVDHRRWLRASKIQTDAQAKLFDRLTSNEDLLSYMQSPAGTRFLQPAPMPIEAGPRPVVAAPVNRILWSVQAGIILAIVGLGLRFARGNVIEEFVGPLNLVAVLAISLGLGFAVSAAVAVGLSYRLGLMDPPKA
jgi:hypothetical protein